MADLFPPKPKSMHYQTYEGLRTEAEAAARRSWPPSLSLYYTALFQLQTSEIRSRAAFTGEGRRIPVS